MSLPVQRWYWVAAIAPIATALYYTLSLVLAYRRLPGEVPIHFDFDGTPNGWMPKILWLFLSPILLGVIISLVFTTKPIFHVTTIMYWCVCGLLSGAFLEINRAAQAHARYRLLPLALWIVLLPACELGLAFGLKRWWT